MRKHKKIAGTINRSKMYVTSRMTAGGIFIDSVAQSKNSFAQI